jgi:hypothetical protein
LRESLDRDARTGLSTESLLWTVGLFCAFIGAFLLVAPHHFRSRPYEALLPFGIVWGTLALGSGVGLLAVAVLRPVRWLGFSVHALAGLALLALAASFARVGAVTGIAVYAVMGLGTIAAGLIPRKRRDGDLFALLMGLVATALGILILTVPELFQKPFYGPYQSILPAFGLVFVLAGPLLCYVQLHRVPNKQAWAVHILCGIAYLMFGVFVAVPGRIWTGIALYWRGSAVITFLPWIRARLAEAQPPARAAGRHAPAAAAAHPAHPRHGRTAPAAPVVGADPRR